MSTPHLDRRLVSLTAPGSFAAEQYYGLCLTVQRLARTRTAQLIAVTSPATGEGKTLTSINLAAGLARGSDSRVLLVDADLRRPAVAKQLGLEDSPGLPGLADILADDTKGFADVACPIDGTRLTVVPSGVLTTSVQGLLQASRLADLLQDARQHYDFVVLDTPPLLPVFDAALLAGAADAVLMVVAAHRTPRKLLGEALNLLDAAKLLGIVFNRDDRPLFGYYDAQYRDYFAAPARAGSGA